MSGNAQNASRCQSRMMRHLFQLSCAASLPSPRWRCFPLSLLRLSWNTNLYAHCLWQGNTPKSCYEVSLHRKSPLCSGKQRADPPPHPRIFIVEIVHDNSHDSVCAYVQSQGRTSTFLFIITTSTSRPQRESTYKRFPLLFTNHVRYCAK